MSSLAKDLAVYEKSPSTCLKPGHMYHISKLLWLIHCSRASAVSYSVQYERGDIWWYENRDDMALMSTKIRACELNGANATRIGRRLGCFIQRTKLRARRQLTGMAKNAAQFAVELFNVNMEALSGPNGIPHLLHC